MTNRDAYWGAKIVMSFTKEQIRAAVDSGQYSNPAAAEYIYQTILERQRKVGEYWFNNMNPVDRFQLQEIRDGKQALCFVDLAVESGIATAADAEYRYDWQHNDQPIQEVKITKEKCLPLPDVNLSQPKSYEDLWSVKIQTKRASKGKWSKWVKVYMRPDPTSGKVVLLGLHRQE